MSGEAAFYKRIRDGLKDFCSGAGYNIDIMRVENILLDGVPDVNFCTHGKEGWIELKSVLTLPVKKETRVFGQKGLRAEQIAWIKNRLKHNGKVFILARLGDYIALVSGTDHNDFNSWSLDDFIVKSLWIHKGRSPDWGKLFWQIAI